MTDPLDANLADDADDPVVDARASATAARPSSVKIVDRSTQRAARLPRSAVAAGDINLHSDTLRTNGLITANTMSAASAQVYGNVEAVTISGSTYNGTTTQIDPPSGRPCPTGPRSSTTTAPTARKSTSAACRLSADPNLGRNVSFDSNDDDYWTGDMPDRWRADATTPTTAQHRRPCCLLCRVRGVLVTAGAVAIHRQLREAGSDYNYESEMYFPAHLAAMWFASSLLTKGHRLGQPIKRRLRRRRSHQLAVPGTRVSATLTAPSWSGDLEYAVITIDTDAAPATSDDFYIDNLNIFEQASGRFIYRQVLSPSVNPFGARPTPRDLLDQLRRQPARDRAFADSGHAAGRQSGRQLMHCRRPDQLVARRGRLSGAASRRRHGHRRRLHHQRHQPRAQRRENDVNYNPGRRRTTTFGTGHRYERHLPLRQSRAWSPSADDLTYQNRPLVRGQVIVGDDIANSSGTLEVDFQPDSLLNPPPGFWAPTRTRAARPRPASRAAVVRCQVSGVRCQLSISGLMADNSNLTTDTRHLTPDTFSCTAGRCSTCWPAIAAPFPAKPTSSTACPRWSRATPIASSAPAGPATSPGPPGSSRADRRRCLLTHHRKLDRWLQLGGHADGQWQVDEVALREAREESGMTGFDFVPIDGTLMPLDVDVHQIPARYDDARPT